MKLMPIQSETRTAKLRQTLQQGTVVLPGAVNALTARAIERAGFTGLYLSGAVLANSLGGVPDIGLMTLTEACTHARQIARACSLPILMDADTGFIDSAEGVARTVLELYEAGVSAIHLEDQQFPKRCGHLGGKTLVPVDEFCAKISAARAAVTDPNFILLARTDARGVTNYDDAVARAHRYLAAGADGIFPEALQNREELTRFSRDVPTLLLANMTEFGQTPYLPVEEWTQLGYRIVIFPVTLQRIMMQAASNALEVLRREGSQQSILGQMQTRQELYDLLDYQP
ncbi:MAG: 2-methylisocitrate lyase [Phycisphaerae bacterium]|nr:2-methylisocitrate lyase [Phycisphaerae bacterium]